MQTIHTWKHAVSTMRPRALHTDHKVASGTVGILYSTFPSSPSSSFICLFFVGNGGHCLNEDISVVENKSTGVELVPVENSAVSITPVACPLPAFPGARWTRVSLPGRGDNFWCASTGFFHPRVPRYGTGNALCSCTVKCMYVELISRRT